MNDVQKYESNNLKFKDVPNLMEHDYRGKVFEQRTLSNALSKFRVKPEKDISNDADNLCRWLEDEQKKDCSWFVRKDIDEQNRLKRLFWMNPQQRALYHRYHVLMNDSTFKTNRFGMPLNVFIVVDTNGKTRLVGCALVSSETTDDYTWILRQLMESVLEQPPGVIMIDAEAAMEAACRDILPDTSIVHCIWHITANNLLRNLGGSLGKETYPDFRRGFWMARNAITEAEFETRWGRLVDQFRDYDNVERYLERPKKSREQWAWPWVGTRFTAGMQSTQRVEQTHAAIKQMVGSNSTINELFEAVERKVSSEEWTKRYLSYKMNMRQAREKARSSADLFPSIHETNRRLLGMFALATIEKEMARVLKYVTEYEEEGKGGRGRGRPVS